VSAAGLRAATVTATVDPFAIERHAINPGVYGVNFADPARMSVVPYPVNRWGGNAETRYNWKVDVHNTASDWFFMNVPDTPLDENNLPDGSSADQFLGGSLDHGAQPILTVPTIGWTPVYTGANASTARDKRWGFSRAGYLPQGTQDWDECLAACGSASCNNWCADDAGNGCLVGGSANHCDAGFVVGNDPHDTSEEITPTFVTDWMTHIISHEGTAAGGGVRFYALDNEPNLWNSTHRDVHPTPLDYDELWNTRTVPYATAIKTKDPGAQIFGPDSWGWCDYFFSAADGCGPGDDHDAHGDLLAWYAQQVCANPLPSGSRLVDYLDIHYYPQGTCVDGLGCSTATAENSSNSARRLRALRELYDPTWHSEDWIGDPNQVNAVIDLVPQMRSIIAANCAPLKLAITEYRWGNDDGASGALAQAEALAIYGREGVDIATRWVAPAANSRTEDAFRFFLDYDNGTAGFQQVAGDSVKVAKTGTVTLDDDVGAYGVHGADGKLRVLLFNHSTAPSNVTLKFAVQVTGPATLFRFDPASNPTPGVPRITNNGALALSANGLALASALSLPGRTAALVVVGLPAFGLPFGDGFEAGTAAHWAH
jgi:hypothetical protein